MLKVGLIGCGEIAVENARAVREAPNAMVALVADTNPELAAALGRTCGAPHAISVDELLASPEVEAVLLSVPHHLHAPLAIQAARAGKHVMVEKPLALSVAEADRMIAAARESGAKLSPIYCQRYLPYVQWAKSLIERGALGRILGVQVELWLDKPPSYYQAGFSGRAQSDWRTSKEASGGGILVFNLVHYLDLIRYLTGLEVARANAEYGALDTPFETEDSLVATLRLSNGAVGTIAASAVARGSSNRQRLRIWGSDGQLDLHEPDAFRCYSLRQVDGRRPGAWYALDRPGMGGERRAYVTRFARAVLEDRDPEIRAEDGRAVQSIVELIYAAGEQDPVATEPAAGRA